MGFALLRRLCRIGAQWLCSGFGLCFAQGSGFAGFGAQALPGSVRVRFGLKKGLNMRGYSGSMGASTNVGRSEHISAFKCVQSVCLSGSAYAKSGYLRLCLNTYLTNCANVYVRFCSNMRVWGGILGDFGVFEGKNGRYPPLKIFEGHFSFQGKTTFSVATLQI